MKLEINHLSKSFNDVTPLKDVSLTINQGEIISIIGPSGTGKTTFVKCLNKLLIPTKGDILIDGHSILDKESSIIELRKRIGIVFQSYNLFSHLTVIENIMYPQIDILKITKQQAYDNAILLLKQVGLVEKAFNYPDELSGGQQQRIAIARTLAMDPEVIILDEPTSALDPTTVGEVETVISKLAKSGKTIIMVTHALDLAKRISTRVIFMSDGVIKEEGTSEQIFENPKNEETKRFVKNLKCLDINIVSKNYDFIDYMNKIRNFCYRNSFSKQEIYYSNLVFEEVVHNNILKSLKDPFKIIFCIEHDEKNNHIGIEIKYTGKNYNPFVSKNMSIDLVKKFCKYKHIFVEKDAINSLLIEFRK